MSTIAAGTTSGTALVSTGDTTGTLVLQTNGTTTAVTIGTNQVVTLAQPLPVASGGTGGSATPTAGGIVYGTGTVQAVTAAGTSGQLLQSNAASAPTWVTFSAGFTLGTPVASTSGTSITFTGIPAGVKQIMVTFVGVSTNGTSYPLLRLGDAGGIEITGYSSMSALFRESEAVRIQTDSTGFVLRSNLAAAVLNGSITLTLENATAYTWTASGVLGDSTAAHGFIMAGSKSLSQELTQVRFTTVGGTDTFDAGEINIAYI